MKKYFILSNYKNYFLAKFFSFISPILKIWEKKYIKQFADMPLKHQPIFIIGAPRTGSTILYQTITNQFDVLYIDNLVSKFYRNLFFGFWLSNKIFKQKAHNCFKSEFGDTAQYGLRAPSECGEFWYRWLPKDRHFIDYEDFDDDMVKEIRSEISAVINFFDKPIVINNNNIALRIRLIQRVFPEARYIVIDREPFFVAQSLLFAREICCGNRNIWWSMMPKNYAEIKEESFFKQVVLQHYYINKLMYSDLKELIDSRFCIIINYSELAHKKNKILLDVKDAICYYNDRISFENNIIYESRKNKLDSVLIKKLKKEIERLDWDDYTS